MSRLYVDIRNIIDLDISIKSPAKANAIGRYKSVFKGKGLEFDGFRNYSEGHEDSNIIDWKASARANELLVKEFVEERNLNIFFLIDISSSMKFSSTKKLKGEYAAEVALSLAHAILQAGDAVGFCLFSDNAKCRFTFAKGPKQFYLFSESITNPRFYRGSFNFNKAVEFLMSFAKKSDVIFLISDFVNMKSDWKERLNLLAQKNDIIGIMVRDIRDSKMPSERGVITVEGVDGGKQLTFNSKDIKRPYEAYTKRQENNIEKIFLGCKQGFIKLYTNQSFIGPVTNFFNLRNRQWR